VEGSRSASFDGPVPVERRRLVRLGEKVPGLLDISRTSSIGQHRPPREIGLGDEVLRIGTSLEAADCAK
jgi:hypothetical protein